MFVIRSDEIAHVSDYFVVPECALKICLGSSVMAGWDKADFALETVAIHSKIIESFTTC